MIEFTRLSHFHIQATQDGRDEARAFYGTLLGLQEIPLPPEFGPKPPVMWFRLLNFDLHVRFCEGFTKVTVAEDIANNPPRHICLEIKHAKVVRKKLEKAGAQIRNGYPFKDRESFFVIDPFGNLIELIEFL
jgi:catechol 2,3-dioxygenase-like lactoylglutathione lyase family enzyme